MISMGMSEDFNSERKAHAPLNGDSKTNLEAVEGLHDAACCASSFVSDAFILMAKHLVKNKQWLTPEIGHWAGVIEQQARGPFDVRDHYSDVRKACEEL